MLNELEKLAKAATPGPWTRQKSPYAVGTGMFSNDYTVCLTSDKDSERQWADAAFIAAANPDMVLKLIAVARAAIAWRDSRGDEDHPSAKQWLAVTVERLCPSTKWWCEKCDVEFIAAIGTPCPECGGTGDDT